VRYSSLSFLASDHFEWWRPLMARRCTKASRKFLHRHYQTHTRWKLLQTILPLQLLSTKKSIQLPIQNGVYLIADLCCFISYSNLFSKKDFFFIAIIFSIKRTPLGLLELIISNKRFFFHSKRLKDFLVLFFLIWTIFKW